MALRRRGEQLHTLGYALGIVNQPAVVDAAHGFNEYVEALSFACGWQAESGLVAVAAIELSDESAVDVDTGIVAHVSDA